MDQPMLPAGQASGSVGDGPDVVVSAPPERVSHLDSDTHTEIIPDNEIYEGLSSDENDEGFEISDENKQR